MTKYIFLDFDGVLNTEFYQNQLISQGKPWGDENGAFFDPEAVMQLKRIVDATCADIVIESSWKYLGLKALREMWAARRLPRRLIDITPFTASDSWLLTAEPNDIDIEMGQFMKRHHDDGFGLIGGKAKAILQIHHRVGFIFGSADDVNDFIDHIACPD